MTEYHNMVVWSYVLCVVLTLNMATLNMATLHCERTFSMSIYDEVFTTPKKSVFLSPIGIRTSLAEAGYVAKGSTQNEIFDIIDRNTKIDFGYIGQPTTSKKFQLDSLKYDKQIFINEQFHLSHMKNIFSDDFQFRYVAFGSSNTTKMVNLFVKDETKNWVEHIFPNSLNKQTAVAKINSLYFHSNWFTEFTSTVKRGFKKPMMHQYGDFLFGNFTELNAAVLEMGFKGNDAKMLIFQPNDNDLQRLSEQLINVNITKIQQRLNRTYMSLYFPIINEIRTFISLKDPLQRMGMDLAFEKEANFDPIRNDVFIREMRHHTSFKCGRENARFVAVTGTQWDLNNSTKQCTCVEDLNSIEYESPDNVQDDIILEPKKKGAPHYYFEHKLFFALMHQNEVVFLGTAATEK